MIDSQWLREASAELDRIAAEDATDYHIEPSIRALSAEFSAVADGAIVHLP